MAKPRSMAPFSVDSPEFFKVYLPEISYQRLRIPPAFVKEFSGQIPNNIILRDITGDYSHVEMEEVENEVFIKNGWQKFVRDHSVIQGDFLVFRYNGKALFDVRIFGRNGCRKNEAWDIDRTAICVKREEETEEEQMHPSNGCKLLPLELGHERTENSGGSQEVDRCKSLRVAAMNSVEHMGPGAASFVKSKSGLEAASFVKPANPHFIAFVGRSSRYGLHIPQHVVKKNNIKLEPEMVMRDENEKLWPVTIATRKDGRRALVKGWVEFWKENKLGRLDQCMFEFIPGRGRTSQEIRVQIIRTSKTK